MTIIFHKTTLKFALLALIATLLLFSIVSVIGTDVSAAPVQVLEVCKDPTKVKSQVCTNTDKNTLFGIITNITNLLLVVIGVISVIMIIIGGFRYTTSAGDAGQTKSARDTIIYAVVGLVIAIMAYAIVNFVLSRI
ncbi:MAG: MMCAP2_0565 family pilin-like conjugal transfer protein [Candidatus Saccharimonadales bacterium]